MSTNYSYGSRVVVVSPLYRLEIKESQTLIQLDPGSGFETAWTVSKRLNTRLVLSRVAPVTGSTIETRVLVDGPKSYHPGRVRDKVEGAGEYDSFYLFTEDDSLLEVFRKRARVVKAETTARLAARKGLESLAQKMTPESLRAVAEILNEQARILEEAQTAADYHRGFKL